ALPVKRQTSYNAWVTIQIGCDNTCAYCIVPAVRGKEISRPFDDIVTEVRRLAADGVTEVTLLGQNVNSYGRDLSLAQRNLGGSDVKIRPQFAQLLRDVGAVSGIRRVRFMSPHPKDMREDVLQAMGETSSVCEHLHYPLQSGSDEILGLMHRGYTVDRYMERLAQARKIIPDLAVTSDIIVGFPGETEKDFQRTLEVAADAMFDAVFTFVFSPRPGTQAAEMTDKFIDHGVMVSRFERLRVVTERTALAASRARIGRIEEVIVEGMSRKNPDRTTGRTRQNKLVHFVSPEPLRLGTYATVEITDAGKHHLVGDLCDIGDAPTHKLRLAVTVAH
ncbi:MAG: MiaB/RimO family radical SAM methylthiotransferase, partial [Actinomycetota bacterium]